MISTESVEAGIRVDIGNIAFVLNKNIIAILIVTLMLIFESARGLGDTIKEVKCASASECFSNGVNSDDTELRIMYYTKAIEFDPYFAEAYNNRGLAFCDEGSYLLAFSDLDSAIRLKPKEHYGYSNMAYLNLIQGFYDDAIEYYSKAIYLDPKSFKDYFGRGLAYSAIKETTLALDDFNKVIELNPEYPNAYYERGKIHHSFTLNDWAIEDFNKAIELKSDYYDAYYQRATVYGDKGNHNELMKDYVLAVKYYNMAINDFEMVVKINPAGIGGSAAKSLIELYISKRDKLIIK